MKHILTLTALLLTPLASLHVSAATVDGFGFGWKFAKGDQQAAIAPDFDDSKWEHVDLPHDWAISGPFGPMDEGGGTGKLPWSGEGWHRKQFELPATAKGQRVQLLFDGVILLVAAQTVRFVKLTARSGHAAGPWAAVAEFEIIKAP